MKRTKIVKDVRLELRSFIRFLTKTGEGSLAGNLDLPEREDLQKATERLEPNSRSLIWIIERADLFDDEKETALTNLWGVLSNAFMIGSRGTISENTTRVLKKGQAGKASAENKRKHDNSPEFLIIKGVVDRLRRPGDEKRPSKFGRAMLDDVNRDLSAAGFPPLKRNDKIARYLKSLQKSPHSSRVRK